MYPAMYVACAMGPEDYPNGLVSAFHDDRGATSSLRTGPRVLHVIAHDVAGFQVLHCGAHGLPIRLPLLIHWTTCASDSYEALG